MPAIENELKNLLRRIENLEHTVYGNGSKGLKSELIELKTEINTFKKLIVWQIGVSLAILGVVLKILL